MSTILRQSLLIAAKDTKIFVRDRFALGFALLFPIVFAIGFSVGLAGVGPSNDKVQFTIVTLEQDGGISHQIIEALTAAPDSSVRTLPYEDAIRAVEDGALSGFLAFPGNFTSNVMSGQPTELEVVAHADSPATQAALESIGRSIAGRLTNVQTTLQAVIELRASAGRSWPPPDRPTLFDQAPLVSFEISRLGDSIPFNPSNFVLTGYVTMFVFFCRRDGRRGHRSRAPKPYPRKTAVQWRQARGGDTGQILGRRLQGDIADSGPMDLRNTCVPHRPRSGTGEPSSWSRCSLSWFPPALASCSPRSFRPSAAATRPACSPRW